MPNLACLAKHICADVCQDDMPLLTIPTRIFAFSSFQERRRFQSLLHVAIVTEPQCQRIAIGPFYKLAVVGGVYAFALIRNLATAFVEDRSLAVGIIDVAVCFANGTTSMMFG